MAGPGGTAGASPDHGRPERQLGLGSGREQAEGIPAGAVGVSGLPGRPH